MELSETGRGGIVAGGGPLDRSARRAASLSAA